MCMQCSYITCTLKFLKKIKIKKTARRTLAQGTGEIHRRWFWSCPHNQQCISVKCTVLDVRFVAGKQPICRMIDTKYEE